MSKVTLASEDRDRRNPRMNIFKNTQGESLPNGWKLKQQVEEWLEEPSRTLPHFLDGDKIARTMAESAGLKAVAPSSSYGKDGSLSIFFSTGAYFAICPGLVEEWRGMVGSETSSFRLDGSEVKLSVIHVDKDEDQSGSIERYRVKLEMNGISVSLTFFNTTLKVFVQGNPEIVRDFVESIFMPWLRRKTVQLRKTIADINARMKVSREKKRSAVSVRTRFKFTPKSKRRSLRATGAEIKHD